jgi:hypothetical protein
MTWWLSFGPCKPIMCQRLTQRRGKLDPQEGSCDRTPFKPEERKKDQLWRLSDHCPRVFGHHEHLVALAQLLF